LSLDPGQNRLEHGKKKLEKNVFWGECRKGDTIQYLFAFGSLEKRDGKLRTVPGGLVELSYWGKTKEEKR